MAPHGPPSQDFRNRELGWSQILQVGVALPCPHHLIDVELPQVPFRLWLPK